MKKWTLAALLALAVGCSRGGTADIATLTSNSDQVIWEAGHKAFEKKQWEPARQFFKRIVDGFPNSEYGPQARLGIADSYFNEGGTGNYVLAAGAYREFLTFYPSHPRSDYAQFQVGESFWKQKNGPDRDQTSTLSALEEFEKVVQYYPNSASAPLAKQRIDECRQSLARADFMAGFFYQKTRKAYRSASLRYESVLKDFPDYKHTDEVLFRLGQALMFSGRRAEALPHLDRLLREYPDSEYAADAKVLMDQPEKAIPAPTAPHPTSAPAPPAPKQS